MESAFVLSPLLLVLIIAGIIAILIKLLKKNPKLAAILLIVPVVCIAVFVLWYFFSKTLPIETHVKEALRVEPYSNSSSPIWSEGIENKLSADVYPSKISAVRELGRKINRTLPLVMEAIDSLQEIEIFQNSQDLELVEEFRKVISQSNPDIKCKIVFENPTSSENVITIYFFINNDYYSLKQVSWQKNPNENIMSGTIRANILVNQKQQVTVPVSFTEKPWVENFANFLNTQPNKQYIVARSAESCLAPEEADRQAMQNVNEQLAPMLIRFQNPFHLENKDIFESGIIADKFVQSFDGSAGKIWREAILLDVSPDKLNRLAANIAGTSRVKINQWVKTILSIAGLFILITIVYAFLNAATRGYYSLTLKIIGIILAAIFLFIILLLFSFRGGPGMGGL
jgi:hypothetical protein